MQHCLGNFMCRLQKIASNDIIRKRMKTTQRAAATVPILLKLQNQWMRVQTWSIPYRRQTEVRYGPNGSGFGRRIELMKL